MRPLALVRSRTRCIRRRSRSRSARSLSEGSHRPGTSSRRESSASRRASTLLVFAASGATVFTLRASATSTCQPHATSSSAAMRPSSAISPPGASAHHCAVRYAQSSPTYFTSGLLPDGIGHRRVSPARRPFFMTFHKGLHTCPTFENLQIDPKQKARYAGILQSPLTDSNRRPPPYHGGALPTELRGRGPDCSPGWGARRDGLRGCLRGG